MQIAIHKNAKTTPKIREEIKNSDKTISQLAKIYNLSWNTVKKWKTRDNTNDKSSRPDKLRTDLTQEQEDLICLTRKQFKKSIDDIAYIMEQELGKEKSYPMKIYRCLRRNGLGKLPKEYEEEENRIIKKFKNYDIGFIHIDLLYSPKIEKERTYIFTAIDRVSKIAYVMFSKTKGIAKGEEFLNKVIQFYPYKINYILTDNGQEFTYKALPKNKKTNKTHPFDLICRKHNIEHRLIKFRSPWTNGMVERFNRKVRDEVFRVKRFETIFDLKEKLIEFINDYNFNKKLKGLKFLTPNEYLTKYLNLSIQPIVI